MTTTAVELDQITSVPLGLIDPHPLNRKRFDPAKLQELADSIASSGLLTPITVRRVGDRYQLVAGERRWRAHGLLERPTILAIVRELTDEQAVEALVVENAQRENPHPLEEADGYAALLEVSDGRITVAELAARVGKSASYILQRLKLRELGPEGREAFWKDELQFSHALVVARLPQEKQAEALAFIWEPDPFAKDGDPRRPIPFREFVERVREDLHLPLKDAPFPTKDEALCPTAGSCVSCPKRTGFSPELFPEIAKKDDECTDRSCYEQKAAAFVARSIDAAKAKHGDALVLLTHAYRGGNPPKPGKPLSAQFWSPAKKGDAGVVPGIVVDNNGMQGPDRRTGQVIWVKVQKPKKASAQGAERFVPSESPAEREAREAREKAEALAEVGRRRRLLEAVLAKTTRLFPALRTGLLFSALPDTWQRGTISKFTNLPAGERAAQLAIAKLSDADYAKETVLALVHRELHEWSPRRGEKPEMLLALAAELKLDAKKIMADPPADTKVLKKTSAAKKKGPIPSTRSTA